MPELKNHAKRISLVFDDMKLEYQTSIDKVYIPSYTDKDRKKKGNGEWIDVLILSTTPILFLFTLDGFFIKMEEG